MKAPAVIDTHVVVAGLLTQQAEAPTARILDGMLAAAFPYVVSIALLAEYRDVLNRAKLRKLHGLSDAEVEAIVVELAQHAIVLHPVASMPAPDPGDQHLWELLAARDDLILVTGDKRLLQSDLGSRMSTPQQFLAG